MSCSLKYIIQVLSRVNTDWAGAQKYFMGKTGVCAIIRTLSQEPWLERANHPIITPHHPLLLVGSADTS